MTTKKDITLRAYMAGPDVFHPDAKANAEIVRVLCEKHGIVALIPLDNEVPTNNSKSKISEDIYLKNKNLMDSADIFIVNMTPFRGPSTDVGTAFEIGYAAAKDIPVFAFTSDMREYKVRVEEYMKHAGNDGQAIEDFGNIDNTMLDKSIVEIKNKLEAVLDSPKFKSCVFLLRKQKEELANNAEVIVSQERQNKPRSAKP